MKYSAFFVVFFLNCGDYEFVYIFNNLLTYKYSTFSSTRRRCSDAARADTKVQPRTVVKYIITNTDKLYNITGNKSLMYAKYMICDGHCK